jgi:hypothetical protein
MEFLFRYLDSTGDTGAQRGCAARGFGWVRQIRSGSVVRMIMILIKNVRGIIGSWFFPDP